MKPRLIAFSRRLASTTLTSVLSFLIIVSPLLGKLSSVARAQDAGEDASGDSFAFSDQSNSIEQAEAADVEHNAVKGRTSPVSSSGAFTHGIDIALPPGRNGFAPSLALTYDSEAFRTESPVGTGWNFGAPSISRDTSAGFPKLARSTAGMRYSNAGAFTGPSGPMVRFDQDEGLDTQPESIVYVPVREYEPVRFEYIASESRWIEHLPSGTKRYYGQHAGRRARVVNELGTHTWLLLQERDTDGNTIDYDYFDLDDPEVGQDRASLIHVQAAPVLKRVSWGANPGAGRAEHLYHVVMDGEPYQHGPINMLAGHVELRTRLDAIWVMGPKVNGTTGQELYWRYDLDLSPSEDTGRLLLRSVTFRAAGVEPTVHSFDYTRNKNTVGIDPKDGISCAVARHLSWGGSENKVDFKEGVYQTGYAMDLPAGATEWETDVNRTLSPRHHAIGHKFRDVDADGLVDILYHPIGGGAPNPQVIESQSFLQSTDGEWLPATSLQTPAGQWGDGLFNIPAGMFVSAIGDIDGDVDPDAVGFATYMKPPTIARDYTHHAQLVRAHHFASGIGWTPPQEILDRLDQSSAPISSDEFQDLLDDLPGYWLEEYLNEKGVFEINQGVRNWNAPPGCVPVFNGHADFPEGTDNVDMIVVDGVVPELDLASDGIQALQSTLDSIPGFEGITWPDGPPPEEIAINAARRPPLKYICLDIDNVAYSTDNTHSERVYIAKNSARGGQPQQAAPVWIHEWPDGVGKRVNLRNVAVPSNPSDPPRDESGQLIPQAVPTRTTYSVGKDFMAPLADVNGDGKADLILLKSLQSGIRPKRDGSHYDVTFVPRAYLSTGGGFELDWSGRRLQPIEADVTGLVDPSWILEAETAQELFNNALPALTSLPAGAQALPISVRTLLSEDELTAAHAVMDSFRPGDDQDPVLQTAFTDELVAAVRGAFFERTPPAVVHLPDVFDSYHRAQQALIDSGIAPEALASLGVDPFSVPDVAVDVSGLLHSNGSRVSVSLADVVRAYGQQVAQPMNGRLPLIPDLKIPVDPDDYEQLEGGMSEQERLAGEAVLAGTRLPDIPLHEAVGVDVSSLAEDALRDDAAKGSASPRDPEPGAGGPVGTGTSAVFEAMQLDDTSSFTASAINILADTTNWECDVQITSGPLKGIARGCLLNTTYPTNVNYNSVLLDLNGDGLSDLITGQRPVWSPESTGELTACTGGHRVHFNRGYRWDLHQEQLAQQTASESYSSPTTAQYLADEDGTLDSGDFAFEKLLNHDGHCGPGKRGEQKGYDFQFVDFAAFLKSESGQRLRAPWGDIAAAGIRGGPWGQPDDVEPEYADKQDVYDAERKDTLPMAAANFADVNADGRVDIVFAVTRASNGQKSDLPEQTVYLNTGRGFRKESGTGFPASVPHIGDYLFTGPRYTGPEQSCLLPSDLNFALWDVTTRKTIGPSDLARLVDVDSDGLVDAVYRGYCESTTGDAVSSVVCSKTAFWRRNLRQVPDLLATTLRSDGAWTDVRYIAGTSLEARNDKHRVMSNALGTVVTDVGHLPTGQMVVQELYRGSGRGDGAWEHLGAGAAEGIELTYDRFVRQEGKARAVGFETVTASFFNGSDCQWTTGRSAGPTQCSWERGPTTTTTYDVEAETHGSSVAHALRGQVRSTRTTAEGSETEYSSAYDYEVTPLGDRAVRIRPYMELQGTQVGGQMLAHGTYYHDRDAYGYARNVMSGPLRSFFGVDPADPESLSTDTTHHHVPGRWWLGREASTEVRGYSQTIAGEPVQEALLSKSVSTYDGNDRLHTVSTLLDQGSDCSDGAEQWSTTTLTYMNDYGWVGAVDTNGRRVTTFPDSLTMFPSMRFTVVPQSESSPGGYLSENLKHDPRFGSTTEHRDANGATTATDFDAYGRPTSVWGPGDALLSQSLYWDPMGGPSGVIQTTHTTEDESFQTYEVWDAAGRLLAKTSDTPDGVVRLAHNRYDGFGRLRESYLPRPATVHGDFAVLSNELYSETVYDAFDRVEREVMPIDPAAPADRQRVVTHAYGLDDSWGPLRHKVTTTNPRGYATERYYDHRNQLSAVIRVGEGTGWLGFAAAYFYKRDGLGNIVEVMDMDGSVRNLTYTTGGALASVNLPHRDQAGGTHEYCYDGFGALEHATTIAGRTATIYRDILGRTTRTETTYQDDLSVTTFGYDCDADEYSRGRLCDIETDNVSMHYGYDAFGRSSSFTVSVDPEVAQDLPTNEFSGTLDYGLAGQLEKATYTGLGPNGADHVLDIGRDALARTTSIRVRTPAGLRPLVDAASYDVMGRVDKIDLSNGVTIDRDFDWATGFFTQASFQKNSSTFAAIRYPLEAYDLNGNPWREERLGQDGVELSGKSHAFNALDYLESTELMMDGDVRSDDAFWYSASGNINSVEGLAGEDVYHYDDGSNAQAVTSIDLATGGTRTLEYDADGWLASDVTFTEDDNGQPFADERTLKYDAAGCLREVSVTRGVVGSAGTTHTTRNTCGLGSERLVRESTDSNGHTQRTYYLPGNVELRLGEGDDNGGLMMFRLPVSDVTVAQLAWNVSDGDIVEAESGYVHTDLRGSVLARTSLDEAQATEYVREAEYGAWGETHEYEDSTKAPRYGFTGEEADPGTGYYYFGSRVYDPTLRRWLSPDPLILGVPEVDEATGSELNLYQYAANNPIRFIDPTGAVVGDIISPKTASAMLNKKPVVTTEHIDLAADFTPAGNVKDGIAAVSGTNPITKEEMSTSGRVMAGAMATPVLGNALKAFVKGVRMVRGAVKAIVKGAGHVDEGADVVEAAVKKADEVEIGDFLESGGRKTEESAQHAREAMDDGCCTTGTIDRQGAASRRAERMKGVKTEKGKDRDEFPPAVIKPDNKKASVKKIKSGDNRSSGSRLGREIKNLKDGTRVRIRRPKEK